MDAIPIYHDVAAVPPSIGHHHGDFLTAVPSNRSMYRSTLLLRCTSLLVASIMLGLVAFAQPSSGASGDFLAASILSYGTPTAVFALGLERRRRPSRCSGRDRGFRWTAGRSRDRPPGRDAARASAGGRPDSHVAAHLLIWAPTLAFIGLLLGAWWTYARSPGRHLYRMNLTAALIFFMFVLMTIHFSLFVLACVEVDKNRRQYSDVVYLPRGDLRETVPVPPTTPWELFSPRRLVLSYFANHYVRFATGADGTVTVARDYSSRQARF
ncbi:uncharacterized protein GLRG_01088 [Colletotrichum graminicola M1.001]|uniref:Uncharacterized protein n=1 Tax=Colletotrichum graminicola (strain M1.001 / M2 / FGSC 10212) TaxID=645133 RepID=E3Q5H7_COLGM|nr:uncharacterized protein GLRG_01088 [Colletotrichum graminicola M1.001]EFQ25944.1 hypothetical protein GLRG_01088 [Colletotrichum graminicola M1.001]